MWSISIIKWIRWGITFEISENIWDHRKILKENFEDLEYLVGNGISTCKTLFLSFKRKILFSHIFRKRFKFFLYHLDSILLRFLSSLDAQWIWGIKGIMLFDCKKEWNTLSCKMLPVSWSIFLEMGNLETRKQSSQMKSSLPKKTWSLFLSKHNYWWEYQLLIKISRSIFSSVDRINFTLTIACIELFLSNLLNLVT